jgi:hypothetical protein
VEDARKAGEFGRGALVGLLAFTLMLVLLLIVFAFNKS